MHTSAFMIGKSDDTIAITGLPTPPFNAATMADQLVKMHDGFRVQKIEIDGWSVRIVGRNASALFLFIDAEEPICAETLAKTMARVSTEYAETMH